MGGVGKSQLTIEYTYKNMEQYDIVKWFQADDTASIIASIEQFLVEVGMPIKDEKENNIAISVLHSWMNSNAHWLFIFDNVESQGIIEKYIPISFQGNIIVTSRNPNWSLYLPLVLDKLNQQEASIFLLKRIQKPEDSNLYLLVERLDGLPLALEQAGAYIYETGLSIYEYVQRFDQYYSQIIQRGKALNYNFTIATTWEISFHKIEVELPKANKFINICGFFAPDNIRKDFFVKSYGKITPKITDIISSPIEFDDILAILRRYSLIQINDFSFSIHRLVQAIIIEKNEDLEKKANAENAWMILSEYIKDLEIKKYDGVNAETFSHILSVVSHLQRLNHHLDSVGDLLHGLGVYLIKCGDFVRAKELLENAMSIHSHTNKNDDQTLARLLISMGNLYYVLGKTEDSIEYYNKALECKDLHVNTIVSIWNHLVGAFLIKGRFEDAKENAYLAYQCYQEQGSELEFEIIINIFNNLGRVLENESDYQAAEEYYEYLISLLCSVGNTDKPSLASVYNNVGMLNLTIGSAEKAIHYFNLAIEIDENWLTAEHPNLARDYNNLGLAYYSTRDFHRARRYLSKALRIQKKLFTEGYYIATTLSNLGMSLEGLRELDKAEKYYSEALEISIKSLGLLNPETAKCMYNLGGLYQLKCDFNNALFYLKQALDIDLEVYKDNHLEVAKDLGKIGCVYLDMYEPNKAKEYFEKSYILYKNVLGDDNNETAIALSYLSFAFLFLKQIKKAHTNFEKSLQVLVKNVGKSHYIIKEKITEFCVISVKTNSYQQVYINKIKALYCPDLSNQFTT
ncbi:hypothetical protein ABH14_03100 [Brevibacillus brevis]|nr:hypothetical protein [Brevibacillus brevis]